jgi:predicted peptidase
MAQSAQEFGTEIVKRVGFRYWLHLPTGYGQDPAQRWPFILFLHGAGERGDNLDLVKVHGIPKLVVDQPEFPFVVASPQCPEEHWWSAETDGLLALVADLQARYAIDPARLYVTGLSMGGFGTWSLALAAPERFAAIAPICGGLYGPARMVARLKDLPVWAFHGVKDPVVPFDQSARLVKALEEMGGRARLTAYPEAGHDAWSETYANPELYHWLLKQHRG